MKMMASSKRGGITMKAQQQQEVTGNSSPAKQVNAWTVRFLSAGEMNIILLGI